MKKGRKTVEESNIIKALTHTPAKVEAYARIIATVKIYFGQYLEKYPERAGDERYIEGLQCSLFGISDILEILDDYEIHYKIQEKHK